MSNRGEDGSRNSSPAIHDRQPDVLPDPQVVDPLQWRPADPANDRVAIAADQRVPDRTGTLWTVEFGGRRWIVRHGYLAGAIRSTLIVFPFSVPVTVTFCPANFAGDFWSLRM